MHCPSPYWTKKITPRNPKTLIIWTIRHLPGSRTRYAKTWRCKCPAALECDCRLELPTHRQDLSKMVACLGKRRFIMQVTLNLWTVSWGRRWDDFVKIQQKKDDQELRTLKWQGQLHQQCDKVTPSYRNTSAHTDRTQWKSQRSFHDVDSPTLLSTTPLFPGVQLVLFLPTTYNSSGNIFPCSFSAFRCSYRIDFYRWLLGSRDNSKF